MKMSLDFDDQGFIVTGPASPLGRMLAETASRRGARVINCLLPGETQPDGNARLSYLTAELSREEEADRLFETASARITGLRVVMSTFSIREVDTACSLADMPLASWNGTVIAELRAAFLISQRAVQEFLSSKQGGRILFLVQDENPAAPGHAIHFTLQNALCALCRSLAKEYGRREIASNVVLIPEGGTMDSITLTRAVETILFLASPEASFVNGEVIPLAGAQAITKGT